MQMIEDVQKKNVIWSLLIQDIAKIMPETVSLNSLKIEFATNTIFFKGKAADRSSLISFKESLEKKDYFKEINFPIENILEKENVIYDFFVKFDGNKIQKIFDI
jgi:Tfp pilus assembly protein PilN